MTTCSICGEVMVGKVESIDRFHADCWLRRKEAIEDVKDSTYYAKAKRSKYR